MYGYFAEVLLNVYVLSHRIPYTYLERISVFDSTPAKMKLKRAKDNINRFCYETTNQVPFMNPLDVRRSKTMVNLHEYEPYISIEGESLYDVQKKVLAWYKGAGAKDPKVEFTDESHFLYIKAPMTYWMANECFIVLPVDKTKTDEENEEYIQKAKEEITRKENNGDYKLIFRFCYISSADSGHNALSSQRAENQKEGS